MKRSRGPKSHPHRPSASQVGVASKVGQVMALDTRRLYRLGELGIFSRDHPPAAERKRKILAVRAIPEERWSPDEWWTLGECLVLDGLLDEGEAMVNDGAGVPTRGTQCDPTESRLTA